MFFEVSECYISLGCWVHEYTVSFAGGAKREQMQGLSYFFLLLLFFFFCRDCSLRASSPFGGYLEKQSRERHARGDSRSLATRLARPNRRACSQATMIAKADNYNVAAILRLIRLCETSITEKLSRTIKASATFRTYRSCVCTLINALSVSWNVI